MSVYWVEYVCLPGSFRLFIAVFWVPPPPIPHPTSDRNHEQLYFPLSDTMKSTAAIFASIFSSAVALPTQTPDLVMTNFAGTACTALATTSAIAVVADKCTA